MHFDRDVLPRVSVDFHCVANLNSKERKFTCKPFMSTIVDLYNLRLQSVIAHILIPGLTLVERTR